MIKGTSLIGDTIKYHKTESRDILSSWFRGTTPIVPDILNTIYNFIVVPPPKGSDMKSIQEQEDAISYRILQDGNEKEKTQNTPHLSRTLTVEIQRVQS